MKQYLEIVKKEEARLGRIVQEMRSTLAEEERDRQAKNRELTELKQQKLDALGWRDKQEIEERIKAFRRQWGMRQYQDPRVLKQPYFGVLELEDDDLGSLSYCLGRSSFFNIIGKVLVLDWREAPISRLYYEYDAGQFYDEEIQGKDRSGVVQSKRQVETSGAQLLSIMEKGMLLARDSEGVWHRTDETGRSISRKEQKVDHRLPEITALISREQFQSIVHPESSTVLLQGGAGSGKTTVGLHRIAYLAYQNPERFRPGKILVVMFNRALQHYISGVLPQLGVEPGVQVETYHSWAGGLLRAAKIPVSYIAHQADAEVTRFKKSPQMIGLIDSYLKSLLEKSRDWFLRELKRFGDPKLHELKTILQSAVPFADFFQLLNSHPLLTRGLQPDSRSKARQLLITRLNRHRLDLYNALSDRNLLKKAMTDDAGQVHSRLLDKVDTWQRMLRAGGNIDFADTGILLWLVQRKGLAAVRPGYAHMMVDEAQDLSQIELATLMYAADREQSITICGDMAQKIKGEVSFDSHEGFAGFVRGQQQKIGAAKVHAETLQVGYRATRPIMNLAWSVLGENPSIATPRDGDPVEIIRTASHAETLACAGKVLQDYQKTRPNALVAVVCRFKAGADRAFEDLKGCGLTNVRRHQRDDFNFAPGIVVTNAHQVKGLEFSAVVILNPCTSHYPDDRENRMLLHVVITRAADHLWLIGHEPMAYGIEKA